MARSYFIPNERQGNFQQGARDLSGALGFAINRKDTERHRDEDELVKRVDLAIQRYGNWKMAAIANPDLFKQYSEAYDTDLGEVQNPETGDIYTWDEVVEKDESGTVIGYKIDLGEGALRYATNKTTPFGMAEPQRQDTGDQYEPPPARTVSDGGGDATDTPRKPATKDKPGARTPPPANQPTPYETGPSQRQEEGEAETASLNAKRLIPLLQAEIASAATQGRDVDATALAEKYISQVEGIGPKGRQAIFKAAEQAQDAVLEAANDPQSLVELNQRYIQRANQLTPFGVQNGIPSLDFWMDAHRNDPQGRRYYKFAGQGMRSAEPNQMPPQPNAPQPGMGERVPQHPQGAQGRVPPPVREPSPAETPSSANPEGVQPGPPPEPTGSRETETSVFQGRVNQIKPIEERENPFAIGGPVSLSVDAVNFTKRALGLENDESSVAMATIYSGRGIKYDELPKEAQTEILSSDPPWDLSNVAGFSSRMDRPSGAILDGTEEAPGPTGPYYSAIQQIEQGLERGQPNRVRVGVQRGINEARKAGVQLRAATRRSQEAVKSASRVAVENQRQFVADARAAIESDPGLAAIYFPEATARYQTAEAQGQKAAQTRIQTQQMRQQAELFRRQVGAQVAAFDENQREIIDAIGEKWVEEAKAQGYINELKGAQADYYRQMGRLKGVELSLRKAALDQMDKEGGANILGFLEFIASLGKISDADAREQIMAAVGGAMEQIPGLPFKYTEGQNSWWSWTPFAEDTPGGIRFDPTDPMFGGGGAGPPAENDTGLVPGYEEQMEGLSNDYGLGG